MPRVVLTTEALDASIMPHPFVLHNPNSPHYCLITLDPGVAQTLQQSSNNAWICIPIHSKSEWCDLSSRREMPGLRVNVTIYEAVSRVQPCGIRIVGHSSIEDPSIKGWAWRVPIEKPESWKEAEAPPSYEDAVLGS